MAGQASISRALEVISHLGGPECTQEELKWAGDIPAGKRLLEWLARQVVDSEVPSSLNADIHSDDRLRTSLSTIALYKDELDILQRISSKVKQDGKKTTVTSVRPPQSYELPSQLRYSLCCLSNSIIQPKEFSVHELGH